MCCSSVQLTSHTAYDASFLPTNGAIFLIHSRFLFLQKAFSAAGNTWQSKHTVTRGANARDSPDIKALYSTVRSFRWVAFQVFSPVMYARKWFVSCWPLHREGQTGRTVNCFRPCICVYWMTKLQLSIYLDISSYPVVGNCWQFSVAYFIALRRMDSMLNVSNNAARCSTMHLRCMHQSTAIQKAW